MGKLITYLFLVLGFLFCLSYVVDAPPRSAALLSSVSQKSYWKAIDTSGGKLFTGVYEGVRSFSEGLAAVKVNGKWGFIDLSGRMVIEPAFDMAGDFSSHYAPVAVLSSRRNSQIKLRASYRIDNECVSVYDSLSWGYINKAGKLVVNTDYIHALPVKGKTGRVLTGWDSTNCYLQEIDLSTGKTSEKRAVDLVETALGSMGYALSKLHKDISPSLTNMDSFRRNPDSDFPTLVKTSDKRYEFVDDNKKQMFGRTFEYASAFYNALAAIQVEDGKIGFINKKGSFQIEPQYIYAQDFYYSNTLARKEGKQGSWGILGKDGKFTPLQFLQNYQCEQYESCCLITPFRNDLALLVFGDYLFLITINGEKRFEEKYVRNVQAISESLYKLTFDIVARDESVLVDMCTGKFCTVRGSISNTGFYGYGAKFGCNSFIEPRLNISGSDFLCFTSFEDKRADLLGENFDCNYSFESIVSQTAQYRRDKHALKSRQNSILHKSSMKCINITYPGLGDCTESIFPMRGRVFSYYNSSGEKEYEGRFIDGFPFFEGFALVKDSQNLLWGFINDRGEYLIKPQYIDAVSFREGVAFVKVPEKGLTNLTGDDGKVLNEFDYSQVGNYSCGRIPVKRNGAWGYASRCGRIIIPICFDEAREFHEGIAAVRRGRLWGYINTEGEYIEPCWYSWVSDVNNGYGYAVLNASSVTTGNDAFLFDFTGSKPRVVRYANSTVEVSGSHCFIPYCQMIPSNVSSESPESSVKLNFETFEIRGLSGVRTFDGKELFPPIYYKLKIVDENTLFHHIPESINICDLSNNSIVETPVSDIELEGDGPYPVKIGKKWGYMDSSGEIVIPPIYDRADPFYYVNGTVALDGKDYLISREGEIRGKGFDRIPENWNKYPTVVEDGKFGFIDYLGNVVIEPKYERAGDYYEEVAPVRVDGKWGYIDINEDWVIEPQYEHAEIFHGEFALVLEKGKSIVINKKNERILTSRRYIALFRRYALYDDRGLYLVDLIKNTETFIGKGYSVAWRMRHGFAVHTPERNMCLYSWLGEPLSKEYDYIFGMSDGLMLVRNNGEYGYINMNGEEVIPVEFKYAGAFSEGYAIALDSKSKYLIDHTGARIREIHPNADRCFCGFYTHSCKERDSYLLLDKNKLPSRFVIPLGDDQYLLKDKYCYVVDTSGEKIIDGKYNRIEKISRDTFVVYNRSGMFVIKPSFTVVDTGLRGNDCKPSGLGGYIIRKWNDKWYFYNDTLEQFVEQGFEDARAFSEGYAAVMLKGRWTYVDENGDYAVRTVYDSVSDFFPLR